jgi:ribonuclease P protein component
MLPAAARLRRSSEFGDVVGRGRRSRGRRLMVYAVRSAARGSDAQVGVGLIVSKKVGTAVVRHRVSRQLRALMRERLGSIVPGARIVIRAFPAAAGASSLRLGRDLDAALYRAGALRETGGDAG